MKDFKPPEFKTKQERLQYWLSKTSEERLAEVERLSREHYGELGRIQKVARIVDLKTGKVIRELRPKE